MGLGRKEEDRLREGDEIKKRWGTNEKCTLKERKSFFWGGGCPFCSTVHTAKILPFFLFQENLSQTECWVFFILPSEQSKRTLSLEQLGGNGAPLSFYFEHGDVIVKGKKMFSGGGSAHIFLRKEKNAPVAINQLHEKKLQFLDKFSLTAHVPP